MDRTSSHGEFNSLERVELSLQNQEALSRNIDSNSSSSAVEPRRGTLQVGEHTSQVTLHFNNEEEKKEHHEVRAEQRNQIMEQVVESSSSYGTSHAFLSEEERFYQVVESSARHRELLSQFSSVDPARRQAEMEVLLGVIHQNNRFLLTQLNRDDLSAVRRKGIKEILKDNQNELDDIFSNPTVLQPREASLISEDVGQDSDLIGRIGTILDHIEEAVLFLRENRITVAEVLQNHAQQHDGEVEDHYSEASYTTAHNSSDASYRTASLLSGSEVSSISEEVLEHGENEVEDPHSEGSVTLESQASSGVPSEPTIDLHLQHRPPTPIPPGYQQFLRGVRREMSSYQRLIAQRLGDAHDAIENHNLPLASIHLGTAIHIIVY